MLLVGERVHDAEARRGGRELLQPGLGVGADDRDGDPALEIAGHVRDRLAAAERHVGRRLDDVAAELAHRNLKRGSGPQRRLLEEQRDVAALERPLVLHARGARRLQPRREVETGRQRLVIEIEDGQEPPAPPRPSRARKTELRQAVRGVSLPLLIGVP